MQVKDNVSLPVEGGAEEEGGEGGCWRQALIFRSQPSPSRFAPLRTKNLFNWPEGSYLKKREFKWVKVDFYLTVLRVQSWFLLLVMIGHVLGERFEQKEN